MESEKKQSSLLLNEINKAINILFGICIICLCFGMITARCSFFLFIPLFFFTSWIIRKALFDRIKELQEKTDIEQKKNESQRMMTVFMNHELRNLLNSITGNTQIMLMDKSLSKKQQESARLVLHSGYMMQQIVNDLLDYSKIEAGKFEIITEDFNLKAVLHHVRGMFSCQIQEKGLDFSLEIPPDTICGLRCDAVRLQQIMANLISNAVKYTETGKITLSVSVKEYELHFSVSDSGEGLTEAEQQEIFLPFRQINARGHRHIQGSGLGLAMVKALVEQMQGKITVQSKAGEGSTFFVTLPIEITDPSITYHNSKNHAFTEIPDMDYQGICVLCVDNTPSHLQAFYQLLKHTGLSADMVKNGYQALCMAKKKKYQLIFWDFTMTETEGMKTLHSLWETDGDNKNTPVIAMTPDKRHKEKDRYKALGFADVMAKPLTREELLEMIDEHIH